MTDKANLNTDINRRNALKALAAAAGAAGIAALPTRWSKPAAIVGAVPTHAQTSCGPLTITSGTASGIQCSGAGWLTFAAGDIFATISSATVGIELTLTTISIGGGSFNGTPPDGSYVTDDAGTAEANGFNYIASSFGDGITFRWTFANPADGCDTFETTLVCAEDV